MIPEDTNPTQKFPEQPLDPVSPPAIEPAAVPEPLDDGTLTPPHGDPVGGAALEPRSAPAAPVDRSAPWPTDDHLTRDLDSRGMAGFTPAPDPEPRVEIPEPLYLSAAEPAPAGDLHPASESQYGESFRDTTTIESAHVEATPVGRDWSETEEGGGEVAPGLGIGAGVPAARPLAHDDLEAAAMASNAVATGPAPVAEAEDPNEARVFGDAPESGPNWMLAFICAWSSAIALREAWVTLAGGKLGPALHNLGVMGYLLVGVGLFAYAFDALQWGKPRRGVGPLVLPTLLTLAGVVCLVLWNNPGRPI